MVALAGMLVPAGSASAREFVADAVPLEVVVQSAAADFGFGVKVCNSGARPVTGRFNFREAGDVSGLLLEKGYPVQFTNGQFLVGCDQASAELAGGVTGAGVSATSPFSSAILGGPRSDPAGGGTYSPAPIAAPIAAAPVVPPTYRTAEVRYRDPSKVIALLAKIPGLSVIADPDVPGPLLMVGPASVVGEAGRFLAAFDQCPAMAQVEATIVTSSLSADRSRAFGVQLREPGASRIGAFDALAGATISIPGLRVYLDGLRSTGEFRANGTLRARVLIGETVKVQDGADVPVRSATSVTDRETRTDVVYRATGNRMTVKLRSLVDNVAVLEIDHELSSQSGDGPLGPTFSSRAFTSLLRVNLGEPNLVSLSGLDSASKVRSRGIFSRADATTAGKLGAFLVFAVERVPCATGPGPQRSEDRKPGADGAHQLDRDADRRDDRAKRSRSRRKLHSSNASSDSAVVDDGA